ncbi:MAG TPA: carboxymuconolactone decarboxylase family protein [Candidatus Nitrosotenuis sp.]|jgi:4-carboxymuconolactone decarboxylase|nr:carboxymuconolactone decarboxylase family protein [Candidatus Nitrosotenuis sp.]
MRQMRAMLGPKADRVAERLRAIDPALAERVVDWAYGDVFTRPGLDLRSRELVSVTCLTLLNLPAQLKTHLIAALNVGVSESELRETFLHLAMFCGFPLALAGLKVLDEVLAERQ